MRPDLPVLMMSGYTEQAVAPQFSKSGPGMTGFLQKPFLAEDLIDVLRRFLEIATRVACNLSVSRHLLPGRRTIYLPFPTSSELSPA